MAQAAAHGTTSSPWVSERISERVRLIRLPPLTGFTPSCSPVQSLSLSQWPPSSHSAMVSKSPMPLASDSTSRLIVL